MFVLCNYYLAYSPKYSISFFFFFALIYVFCLLKEIDNMLACIVKWQYAVTVKKEGAIKKEGVPLAEAIQRWHVLGCGSLLDPI